MVRATVPLKSVCAEQISKLQVRHQHDLELLDDIRTFAKQRSAIEATYAQAMLKLVQQQQKKDPSAEKESESSVDKSTEKGGSSKNPQKVWRNFVEETERLAKCHQQMADIYMQQVCEPAQILRKSKAQVLKKVVDQLTILQKEAIQASNELTECHKAYTKEEQTAFEARQKAEQLEDKVKKKSTGLFQSMASLQKKSEKSTSVRDQCDLKSTSARNTYLIQLTVVNSQLSKYFEQDLPSLIRQLDSNVTGQIQQFLATICRAELETCSVGLKGIGWVQSDVELLSGQQTMQNFFNDYPIFTEVVQYPFEPIEGDQVDHVSTLHGGDEMIAAETRKFSNFLVQEAKNINGLKRELVNIRRTLVNAGRLASPGEASAADAAKSTMAIVEDCDARLDDIRMAIRRSRTSKLKAEAVLELFKDVGIDVARHADTVAESEEEDEDDETICADIRQLQHQLRVGALQPNLNLPGSVSPNASVGRMSALSVQLGSSGSASQTSSAVASPNPQTTQKQKPERMTSVPATIGGGSSIAETPKATTANQRFEYSTSSAKSASVDTEKSDTVRQSGGATQSFDFQPSAAQMEEDDEQILQQELQQETAAPAEKWSSGMRFPLFGVSLYDYQAGNYDELSVFAGDRLEVVGDGDSEGWLSARTQTGQSGFIPQAYLGTFQTEDELQVYIANMERENREAAKEKQQAEIPTPPQPQPQPEPQAPEQLGDNFAAVPSFELTQASPTTEIADSELKQIVSGQSSQLPSQTVAPSCVGENGGAQPLSAELYAQAVYDFDGVDEDELSFLEGDVIRVLARDYNGVDDGYWFGELNGGRRGWFPSLVVEVLDSPNGEISLPGELKSPESGPPAFIPPPPVVLIEATPLPTPLDSPTGSHGYKRGQRGGKDEGQQDEDADSGFGGTSSVAATTAEGQSGGVPGQSSQDDGEVDGVQQRSLIETSEQNQGVSENREEQPGGETSADATGTGQPKIDVVALLRKRAAEITEMVLSEAREAMEKGELVVSESLSDEDVEAEHVEKAEAVVASAIEGAAEVIASSSGGDVPSEETQRKRICSASAVSISSEGAVSLGGEEGGDFHTVIASTVAPKVEAGEVSEESGVKEDDDELSLR